MRDLPTGIVSYAGFDKNKLWLQARQAFSQAGDAVPERFASFLPLFPIELIQTMPYVGLPEGSRGFATAAGFSIDPSEYHRMLYGEMPELYAGDNYKRNFDYEGRFVGRGVFTVDQAWATAFPQYQPFQGERLALYPIGGGPQAVAVPESIYPRGRGVLHSSEAEMRVSTRAEHFRAYVLERVLQGEAYDGSRFESEYMAECQLQPVTIRQAELGRMMQDIAILKNLRDESEVVGLFTENAKRAEHIPQYTPCHIACDAFENATTTRNTARLVQLYYDDDDFISDMWLPYQDATAYLNRLDMVLDVRALCEGFQIPPRYDPESRGGRYPNRVRVAIVRDRNLRPMIADTLNNPAYGSGMSDLGLINKRTLLKDSRELLRQKKLTLETETFRCEQTALPARDYRVMLERAAVQERKGALIDAMYRRESALSQMKADSTAYQRAKELLDQRVRVLEEAALVRGSREQQAQLSGYDADIDYLRRMEQSREHIGDEDDDSAALHKPLPFTPNALRVMSIESGYAMRSGVYRCRYEDIALPEEPIGEPMTAEAAAAEVEPLGEPVGEEEVASPSAEPIADKEAECEKLSDAMTAEGAEAEVEPFGEPVGEEEAIVPSAEPTSNKEAESEKLCDEKTVEATEVNPSGEPIAEQNAESSGEPMAEAVAIPADHPDAANEADYSAVPHNEPDHVNEALVTTAPPHIARTMAALTNRAPSRPPMQNPSGRMAELLKKNRH